MKYFSTITKLSRFLYPRSYRSYQNVIQKKGYRTSIDDDVVKIKIPKNKARDSVVIDSSFGFPVKPAKEKKGIERVIQLEPRKVKFDDLEFKRDRDKDMVPKELGIRRRKTIDLEFEREEDMVLKNKKLKLISAKDVAGQESMSERDRDMVPVNEKPKSISNKVVVQDSTKKEKTTIKLKKMETNHKITTLANGIPNVTTGIAPDILDKLDRSYFREGDMVILRDTKRSEGQKRKLIGPLKRGSKSKEKNSEVIEHDLIIGQPIRSMIKTMQKKPKNRKIYALHFPTLEEYCLLIPRTKTPTYAKDASTIITLLDINPYSRIMEAGTGNASLTLYLARALYPLGHLHSIDIDPVSSENAKKAFKNFSRGIYSDVVKFSTGKCSDVIDAIDEEYDGVALDMPEPLNELPSIISKLKIDRFMVCYLPNMTQVLTLCQLIRKQKLRLGLERVLEIQWRPWEIKATVIRSRMNSKEVSVKELINKDEIPDEALGYVCRPSHEPTAHTAFLVHLKKISELPMQTKDINDAEDDNSDNHDVENDTDDDNSDNYDIENNTEDGDS
ncbi:7166_t:CDS:2 [Diversispora eburnea]|uniref:tRNA (adenine(58)-N(1))-methyltransferase catalytic subunit TRM61 n=1 Tax=Diversispora eburnea TaxID=1213867 RepID=A0A9N9FVT1_9GLOM|nr:7166_t:CDS:2 [Diversispora eburnea]